MSAAPTDDLRPWAVYRRLLGYALPHWKVLLGALFATAVFAAVDASFAALVQPLLDEAFVARDETYIRWLPVAIIGLFLLRGLSSFASAYGMAWVSRRVVMEVRRSLYDHLIRLPVSWYDEVSPGHVISRLTYHVEQVADAVTTVLTQALKNGLTIAALLGWMFWLNWELTLFACAVMPFIALTIGYVSRRFRLISRRIQQTVSDVADSAEQTVSGQRVIKLANAEPIEQVRFQKVNNLNRQLAMKIVATRAGSASIIQFIAAWAVAAIVYVATLPTMLEQMSPGAFASFMLAMLSLLQPIKGLGQLNEKLQRGIAAGIEIFQTLSAAAEPPGGTRTLERAEGHLRFDQLRFAYRSQPTEVLQGISLEIPAGKTVAFVGRSGSGKSTLLSLIPRFYDPSSGCITLDGHDLRDYRLQDLRRQIAVVDQHVQLFHASIADNIAYGLPVRPDAATLERAARDANAWEFIEKLPEGLATIIGPSGQQLSGGQRQRIAIARALLKNAPILILDEATSALDSESERLVQAAMEKLVVGRTTLVIAHRLSTVQTADLIVVMQDGRIIETGDHLKLLARNGLYAALYQMQFATHDADRAA